jgi:hypothetical protein
MTFASSLDSALRYSAHELLLRKEEYEHREYGRDEGAGHYRGPIHTSERIFHEKELERNGIGAYLIEIDERIQEIIP